MYEQDIELTKLLLDKLHQLDEHGEALRSKVEQLQGELEETVNIRDERESYLDVLSRAANLLDRSDLQVESPETTTLESEINDLKSQMEAIDQEVIQYRKLVDELRERAPKLLQAASTNEPDAPNGEPAADKVDAEEVGSTSPFDQPEPAPAGDDPPAEGAGSSEEPAPVAAPAEHVEFSRPTELSQLFNLKDLKVKEAFTYGLGAAYIVDATSVLDRVPHYDKHFLALPEAQIRDELINDINWLSSQISGDFFIIFTTPYEPAIERSAHVKIEFAGDETTKEQADNRVLEMVSEILDKDRVACVVTGDSTLGDTVRNQDVHVIALGDFFNT
ncbi:NYN domain-containing protein [bacterium]|nr:NYN domain-containing protein [bacterium]